MAEINELPGIVQLANLCNTVVESQDKDGDDGVVGSHDHHW